MDKVKFRAMFLAEAAEHLQAMSAILLRLDNDPDNRIEIDALFREAHSIKGMAATMDFNKTAELAHSLEDKLDQCRKQGRVEAPEIDQLLAGVDLLEELLEDIRCGRPERDVDPFLRRQAVVPDRDLLQDGTRVTNPGGDVESRSEADAAPNPILVQIQLSDSVAVAAPRLLVLFKRLTEFGEVIQSWPSQEQILTDKVEGTLLVHLRPRVTVEEIRRQLDRYSEIEAVNFPEPQAAATGRATTAGVRGTSVRVNTERLDHLINLTGELITTRHHLQNALKQRHWDNLEEGIGQLSQLVKNLHHQVLQVRMVSLEGLFSRLSRTVHDLARSSGKKIDLQTFGADIEIDRAIVEELGDPLNHMIRNAVDHGIRSEGIIRLKAWRERDQVVVQVADNGVGIDPEAIRRSALKKGLVTAAQVAGMQDFDLYQLICRPGFSTSEEVTGISGRGVGMDVVKTTVEGIGGLVLIDSTLGEGTSITLKLPLSLAIIRVLLVESAGARMGIPITRVIQAVEVDLKDIQSSGKQLMVRYQNAFIPLLSLRKMLKQPKGRQDGTVSLVVSEVMGRRIGLVVDRLIGQQEVFVQRLPSPFDQIPGCHGGTILGDGQVVFLLDLQSLMDRRLKEQDGGRG